ncbi:MAG: CocE/NonD family hydrolase [Planctomycetes bacterium]|nr:CocE/NonD family hydrolase [Planctomycetota bacterium]
MKRAISFSFSVIVIFLHCLPSTLTAKADNVVYNGWSRTSQYVTVRDGTRIAVDIMRPAYNGAAAKRPLPVIWEQRRYHRASVQDGRIRCQLDRGDHPMRDVGSHGCVYVVADVRGSGASFGSRTDPNPPVEVLDAYDITEWIAKQNWCDGKIGMYGISYGGTAQFTAAAGKPPHLRAVFPEMAMFDIYPFCYSGGIFRRQTMQKWSKSTSGLDRNLSRQVAPVDDDRQGQWLKAAIQEHYGNLNVLKETLAHPFRDGYMQSSKGQHYISHNPCSHLEQVNQSGVGIYLRAGWWDMYPKDMLLWYVNLKTPKKIVIGPWNHYSSEGFNRGEEMRRWYDYWLKGIDNGIMKEPPIRYYTLSAPKGKQWRTSYTWPPKSSHYQKYYFHAGPSGSVSSVNDGLMSREKPAVTEGDDSYIVDYTTTSGTATRWLFVKPNYPDMQNNDRKGLTYTTAPLENAVEVTGHPVIHLWITSSEDDGDFFAYLEEVDRSGVSSYISEGMLRASHRKLSPAPFNNLGLPYHRSFKEDLEKLPSEPTELVFDLLPISKVFVAGNRIRITITCTDKDNAYTPTVIPAPTVRLYRNASASSYIKLPIAQTQDH